MKKKINKYTSELGKLSALSRRKKHGKNFNKVMKELAMKSVEKRKKISTEKTLKDNENKLK